jgi:predicted esterase YcpF (UPF0227 family)
MAYVGVSFGTAQVIFEPNLFPYEYSNISANYLFYTYLPMKMEQTECSETSVYKIQTPWNYAEESIKYSEHDESFKSRTFIKFVTPLFRIVSRSSVLLFMIFWDIPKEIDAILSDTPRMLPYFPLRTNP